MIKNIARALRLPFVGASSLPFIFGSLIKRGDFNIRSFILGLIAVITAHLSANLLNDYCDSKSRADWQDKNFYKFFGGSKLIQEGVLRESFYLKASMLCVFISVICVVALAFILNSLSVIGFYLAIIILSWSYSLKPIQFSYRRLGEVIIFLLFGPALVMGGYFIQTKIFPSWQSFVLSLPFGFFTTAILFANEIPDFNDDRKTGKFTWVSFLGQGKSFLLYYILMFLGFSSIILGIVLGYLGWIAGFSFILMIPAIKAGNILRRDFSDKIRLLESSKLTIAVQAFVSIILILDIVL